MKIDSCNWEITKSCNLHCIHCIFDCSRYSTAELSTMNAIKLIKQLKENGCKLIKITGGEPLLRKDLFELLAFCKKLNIEVCLLTNGTLINKKNVKLLKNFVSEVGVSLDGPDPEVNDKIRGKGTFKKIVRALSLLLAEKIPTSLYITFNMQNFCFLEETIRLATGMGIKQIRIYDTNLLGRAWKNRAMLEFAEGRSQIKKKLIKIITRYTAEKFQKIDECLADGREVFISACGYIYPCTEVYQLSPHKGVKDIRNLAVKKRKEKCCYEILANEDFILCLRRSDRCCLT